MENQLVRNQLNNHQARGDLCKKKLKECRYVWDVLGGKILCNECYDRREIKIPENIIDTFINFFHLPK